jgi:uncharacterized OsmC-like protein/pimeloyl-ACP methyl ester carboxylesterase
MSGDDTMKTERLEFPGSLGAPLAARLDLPDGPVLSVALFAHCFSCSKDIPAARRIASRLTASGLAVLRFDFTGLGHSGGEFENTTFTSNVQDLVAAAEYLSARNLAPGLLIGHSLGGAAVLKAAGQIASIKAVATIGAPFDPAHVTHNFADSLPKIEADGVADVNLGGRPFRIGKEFVDDVNSEHLATAIGNLKRALLVLHAPNDAIVGVENATNIFLAAKHPKSFVTLDDADHLVTRPQDAEYAAEVIAAWAGRYLDIAAPTPPKHAPEGVVRVSEADSNGFLQDITLGPAIHMVADEPVSYGGTNKGPSPYGFVSAGLGACTTMTLRMYARRKGLDLTHVWVDVSHDKIHATDAEGDTSRIDSFIRDVHLEGNLTDAERQRLLEIADKCPVHRTLHAGAKVIPRLF